MSANRRLLLALAMVLAGGLFLVLTREMAGLPTAEVAPAREVAAPPAAIPQGGGKSAVAPAPVAVARPGAEQPPPDGVSLADGYPILGTQRTFYRKAGMVAVRFRDGDSFERQSAAGG